MTTERAAPRRLWRLHTKAVVENGSRVLFVEGRLGHAAAAELEAVTGQQPAAGANLILDLSGVDYLSSAALKVLEALAGRQSQRGGRLLLRAPSIAARLALELSGLMALVDSVALEKVGAAGEPEDGAEAASNVNNQ